MRRRALGRRGHETVRRLLAAGLAEIDEHGFHAMRVDDVARLADFSSKEDLLAELLREALHRLAEAITTGITAASRNARDASDRQATPAGQTSTPS